MPAHTHLDLNRISSEARDKLQRSLVLIYGGMAQNVGPILEMVTEKYLVRAEKEWSARQDAKAILDGILEALEQGDIRRVGELTTKNFTARYKRLFPGVPIVSPTR